MHYIYHIPGEKIGCSVDPENRVKEQGFTEYEILEQYEDPEIAGDRERELQKQYGYRVDRVHYVQAIANRRKWTIEDTYKGLQRRKELGLVNTVPARINSAISRIKTKEDRWLLILADLANKQTFRQKDVRALGYTSRMVQMFVDQCPKVYKIKRGLYGIYN